MSFRFDFFNKHKMTFSLLLPAPPPREPERPRLRELMKLLAAGDFSRYARMIDACERLYPLEVAPPVIERQSRFRPAFA